MKSKLLKKASTVAVSAAMLVNSFLVGSISAVTAADDTKYEFENGTLVGATVPAAGSERYCEGASGDQFVFLQEAGETASVTVNVEETGMYSVILNYSAPYGDKQHGLIVNGTDQGNFGCATTDDGVWSEINIGTVKLDKGDNTITIKSSWGWTNLDYLRVESAVRPEISASDTTPCDPNATKETVSLMNYLSSVYGEHIISGQQEIYKYGPHDFEYEFNFIKELTGKSPAIRGFDYLNLVNPLYGSDDGTNERIINWVKNNNGIATASWHIVVPKDFDSYTIGSNVSYENATYKPDETTFDTSKILDETSKEYEYFMLCLSDLAKAIKELQDNDVPLIFRPWHEAEGGGGETGSWFWWGKSGSAVYKELWKLTYKTLTEDYGLHNVIWEWNSYTFDTSENWYPGDNYVDIIAYDKYSCTDWSTGQPVISHNDSAISSTFYTLMEKYNSKKMIAMAENDSIPTVENLTAEKAGWLYFCPWYDGGSDDTNFLSNEIFNTKADLTTMYQSDYCITLDELPLDLYSKEIDIKPTTGTTTTNENVSTNPTTTTTSTTVAEGHAKITSDKDGYTLVFPKAVGDTIYLDIDLNDDVTYANGCVASTVELDGSYYWASVQWEATKDGVVKLDMNKTYNVILNDETVTDEAIIEQVVDKLKQLTVLSGQIWYVQNGDEEQVDNSNAAIVDAYLPSEEDDDIVYGDANLDDKITIDDVVAIICYSSDPEAFPLSDEAINRADVYQRGDGLSGNDAVSVQKNLALQLDKLPESYLN